MNSLELCVIRDGEAKEAVVVEIYATTDAGYREEVTLDEFREHLSESRIVVARKEERIVGWAGFHCDAERDTDETTSLRGAAITFHADQDDIHVLSRLLHAAAEEVRPDGVVWPSRIGEFHEQLAGETGAVAHRELFRVWQTPREAWPATSDFPLAETSAIRTPLADEALGRYADFFTKAKVTRCSEESCTTTWDTTMVAEELAQREGHGLTQVLDEQGCVTGEAFAFAGGDEMMLVITQHQATTKGLTALIAALLERIRVTHPQIGIVTIEAEPDELGPLVPALAACGFEDKGARVLYHLRPRGAPDL
ncbi:hypothetical protein AB4Z34_01395 [Ensifer sp. 2YAB10]|uniref:hypothetical protein n=1 Tax=unclassified Ensifer TaxID=2633371 RepID=UPI003F90AEB6